jgi:hypothetical protein
MANDFWNFMSAGGAGAAGSLLGGLFGDSGAPYEDAMKQYQDWANKAQNVQNPYLQAGQGAIGDYQNWLKKQQDPSGFINNMMNQYQESPYAKFLQQQSIRGGQNAASASGLMGSTPFAQQLQQNAGNIASGDMNQWLQNVLGINTQYGQGQQNLMTGGQNAANALTGMYGDMGRQMGEAAYGKKAGQNQDWSNMIGGGLQLAAMFL